METENRSAVTFRTPEHLSFSLDLAGPAIRFVACLIDLAIIAAANSMLSTFLALLGLVSRNLAAAVLTLSYFVLSVGYAMAMEWLCRGQTYGKKLMGLRVLDAEGLRLRPYQVILRNLFRPLDLLPFFYLVGGTACLFSPKGQRLGDMVANTLVVRDSKPGRPDLEKFLSGKYNSFLAYRHLAARLRQQVSPGEAAIAIQALLRRDEIGDHDRVALFADLKTHFAGLVEFPPEAIEGLPDEQYVTNVVGVLYR